MAYCFEVDETVEAAIRRIAHEQLTRIVSRLEPGGGEPERAVHAARRSLKRLRGLALPENPSRGSLCQRREGPCQWQWLEGRNLHQRLSQ